MERYPHTESLSGDSAWHLFEDREGIIWVGTTSGIDSFRDPRITTFSQVEGLAKNLAAGILAHRDGTIWVANNESLDRIKDGTVSSIRKSDGLPGEQVAAMLEDRAGNMWVGVDDGLYLFKEGRFRRVPEPDHKPLGMVVGMAEDIDGNVWRNCRSTWRNLDRYSEGRYRLVPQWFCGTKPSARSWRVSVAPPNRGGGRRFTTRRLRERPRRIAAG